MNKTKATWIGVSFGGILGAASALAPAWAATLYRFEGNRFIDNINANLTQQQTLPCSPTDFTCLNSIPPPNPSIDSFFNGAWLKPVSLLDVTNATTVLATSVAANVTSSIAYQIAPPNPRDTAPNTQLVYNRVGLVEVGQTTLNNVQVPVSRIVFFCVPQTTDPRVPQTCSNSLIGNQPANPNSAYFATMAILGNLLTPFGNNNALVPPYTLGADGFPDFALLTAINLGNVNQICSQFGQTVIDNNCKGGENSRVELNGLQGKVSRVIPAPLPLAGTLPMGVMLKRLARKRRKLLQTAV